MRNGVHVGRRNVERDANVLAQQNPLEAVGRHAVLVVGLGVALRVGAAGRCGALGRAQVVHEWQTVLATEVHKLDVAHARVKVNACQRNQKS